MNPEKSPGGEVDIRLGEQTQQLNNSVGSMYAVPEQSLIPTARGTGITDGTRGDGERAQQD